MGEVFLIIRNESQKRFLINVTHISGNWNNSAKTGTFYWNLNNDTSNRNRNISGHLVNARNVIFFALPLGKI